MTFRPVELIWLGVMAAGPVLTLIAAVFEMRSEPWKQRPLSCRVFYTTGMACVYIGLVAGIVIFSMLVKGG